MTTCCSCCTPKVAKWSTFVTSVVVLVLGIIFGVFWNEWFDKIVNYEISVSSRSTVGFGKWQETPIPLYLDFYMFNCTNAHLVAKDPGIKPIFTQMGPYVFYEHHIRENITFNDNNTVTYLNKRNWSFKPEMTTGSLSDMVTFVNPIAVVIGNIIKDQDYLVKRAVNFFLIEKGETLFRTRNVSQLLFEGYDDTLIRIAKKLNISGFDLPFTKFGWFVDRNNSATYDGVFNMYDGSGDISKLGLITRWNYQHKTPYYDGQCGEVNGSSGELWWPPHDDESITIFAPDLCSNVILHNNGTETLQGVEGHQFVAGEDVFDNGTLYNSSSCFASGLPSGVRNVEKCKWGAPAFASFPHFYLADPVYRREVEGMNPNSELHATVISIEPKTGIPMRVNAAFQINLLMRNMTGIDIFENIKTTMMPMFWFRQHAELTSDLASLAKLMLVAGKAGTYTGFGLIGIGALVMVVFGVVTHRKGWGTKEEEYLVRNGTAGDILHS